MRHRHHRSLTAAAALCAAAATAASAGCSDRDLGTEAAAGGGTTSSSSSEARSSDAAPTATIPPAPPAHSVAPFIESAEWADSDYGVTLEIAPTAAGRGAPGPQDAADAWQEVLRAAPDAGTPGMWEQFDCHWTWARLLEPDKPTWNIEPWRPVVGADRMLAEGCNPGGPEV